MIAKKTQFLRLVQWLGVWFVLLGQSPLAFSLPESDLEEGVETVLKPFLQENPPEFFRAQDGLGISFFHFRPEDKVMAPPID